MDEYYKNAHKTPETMKQIIKIQSERLKELNKDYKKLKLEQKKTYREMVYFRNQNKKKTQEIKQLKEMMGNAL